MSRPAVVRNYAEALVELADRQDAVDPFGEHISEAAALYRLEEDFRLFLETPRVPLEEKKRVLREAWSDRAPAAFVHFLLVVLEKGRQRQLPRIAEAYRELVDEREGRIHATVTLAREPDDAFRREISDALEEGMDAEVVPHFRVDEGIIGGVVVRMEDHVMDGSLRRRLADLEARLLEGQEAG